MMDEDALGVSAYIPESDSAKEHGNARISMSR